jgi:DNA-binding response OmpR family regulator
MPALGTILVIEDDDGNRDFIVEALNDEGYTVRGVRDAADGYSALLDYSPDLVLCSFHLYDSNGLAFARTLQLAGVDVPIVLMTADNHPPDHPDMAHIAFCLLKPFGLDELLACIAAHIRISRL